MTRKEELEQKAMEAVDIVYGRVDRNADLDEYDKRECVENICAMFLQVEREVLQRVDHYYSHQIHHDMDDYPDKFVTWLRAQQQELT